MNKSQVVKDPSYQVKELGLCAGAKEVFYFILLLLFFNIFIGV